LWELGRDPNLRIKIVCASEAIAVDRSRFLRRSIERNPKIRKVFPHLRPSEPWRAQAFTVARGPSIAEFGIGAASTGEMRTRSAGSMEAFGRAAPWSQSPASGDRPVLMSIRTRKSARSWSR